MKNILDIELSPITTFPHYAGPLSFVCYMQKVKEWMLSSYVNIFLDYRYHVDLFTLRYRQELTKLPFLRMYAIKDYRAFFNNDKYLDNIRNILNQNMYLSVNVDRYFISENKRKKHVIHPTYLYGYDDNTRLFYILDYFGNLAGKYGICSISYEGYEESLREIDGLDYNHPNNPSQKHFINTYEILDTSYGFDQQKLKNELDDFLNSKNTMDDSDEMSNNRISEETIWGLNTYKILNDYFNSSSIDNIDIRIFHLFKERASLSINRISYLKSINIISAENDIDKQFAILYSITTVLFNLAIKFNRLKEDEKSCLQKITEYIIQLKNADEICSAALYNLL